MNHYLRLGVAALAGIALFTQVGAAAQAGNGDGQDGYGITRDFESGFITPITYTHGFYCDLSVPAKSQSGCEAGTSYKRPPARQFDQLYITVPLGFTVPPMDMQCPTGLVCIDHPATIDLSAIGGPGDAMTPGHDHYTTTRNNGVPEWWDVEVVGVTDSATYNDIRAHGSFAYIDHLIKMGDKHLTKPIPTNLFLFFGVGR